MFQPKKLTLAKNLSENALYKQQDTDNVKKYFTELCRLAKLALPRIQDAPIICYNCNREGHFSRDCQAPRRPRF
jgi:hypothetical protein